MAPGIFSCSWRKYSSINISHAAPGVMHVLRAVLRLPPSPYLTIFDSKSTTMLCTLSVILQISLVAAGACRNIATYNGVDCPFIQVGSRDPQRTSSRFISTCTHGTVNVAISRTDLQHGKLQITNKDTGKRAFAAILRTGAGRKTGLAFLLDPGEVCDATIDPVLKDLVQVFTTATQYH